MEVNNIQLSPFLVTELYKNSLVESSEKIDSTAETSNNITWKYLGNNEKNVLIVVNYHDAVHLPDTQLDFLSKLLSACKLSIGDTAILNIRQNTGITYKTAYEHLRSKNVLLFDVEPTLLGLPLNFPQFQVQSFSGQTYLFAPSLNELEENDLLKSKLWVCLRRIFGV